MKKRAQNQTLFSLLLAGIAFNGCGATSNTTAYPVTQNGVGSNNSSGLTGTRVNLKVNFAPALLTRQIRARSLEDTVTGLEVHVLDPDTLDDVLDPVTIPYNGEPGQVITVNVPLGGHEKVDVRAVDSDGEEVGDGDADITEEAEFRQERVLARSDTDPVVVTMAPPNFNDSGAWIAQGPGPLFDNTGEQQQDVGGRDSSVVSDPADANTVYLGTATSGVWKSSNGGNTWAPITDNQPSLAVGALALVGSNTLYVGTGESNSNGFYGAGLYKSGDSGSTFTNLNPGGVFTNKAFSRIAVHPTNSNIVLAGIYPVSGSNFGGTYITSDGNVGPFLSTDGGATFVNAFATSFGANPNRPCTDVSMEPDGSAFYAAVDATSTTGSQSGIYRSNDAGATWTQLTFKDAANNVLVASTAISRIRLATARVDANTTVLYALVGNAAGEHFQGLFASTNGGTSWIKVTSTPVAVENQLNGQSNYNNALAVDRLDPRSVYVGGVSPAKVTGIDLTTGTATSVRLQVAATRSDNVHPHVDYQYFETLNVGGASVLRATTDGGLWQLPNPAAAIATTPWVNLNGNQSTGRVESLQMYGLAVNPRNDKQAWTGMQDNGSAATTNNRRWLEPQGGDGALSRVDPSDPKIVYLASANTGSGIGLNRYNDGGVSSSNSTVVTTGINLKDPAEFVTPFVIHPLENKRLALGTNQVYETTNSGDQWSVVSGGALAQGQNITTLAYHPKNAAFLYAGLANGRVFSRLQAGGGFTGGVVSAGKRVSAIVVDENDGTGKTAYASVVTFTGAKVFKTIDGGANWTDYSTGLPDSPVMSLALDSSLKPNRLYCGTDTEGVFQRADGAANFTRFGTGLLPIQITGLEITGRVLSAASYGRGLYQIPITSDQTKVQAFTIVGNPPISGKASPDLILPRLANPHY